MIIKPFIHTLHGQLCIGGTIKPLRSNDQVAGSYCNTLPPYLGSWAAKPESVRAETEGCEGLAIKHAHNVSMLEF